MVVNMKVKELIKDLEYFCLQDEDSEILAYLYDENLDVEHEYEINIEGDIIPALVLKEVEE